MIQIIALRKGHVYPGGKKIAVATLAEVYRAANEIMSAVPEGEKWNLFYTLAHHAGAETSPTPIRAGKTFFSQEAIAWDIDGIDNSKHPEYISLVSNVLTIQPETMTLIASGNGLHFIAFLKDPIRDVAYFQANKAHYNEICTKINFALADAGLPGKADPVVFEPARILRLPMSENRKGETIKQCVPLNIAVVRQDVKLQDISGLGDISRDNISLSEVRKLYPNPDLPHMLGDTGCPFMKWVLEKTDEVHEPQAFDMFSVLAQVPDSTLVTVAGQSLSPKQLAEHIFKNATASKSLATGRFENKWQQAVRYGVRKCSTIESRWLHAEGCQACPHYGKIRTPLDLKSAEHIATASQGYWLMDHKGRYLSPHYGDLQRVYKGEFHYVVSAESRKLYTFGGTHYAQVPELQTKSWLEQRMNPSDPVKEAHRHEFISKIRANSVLSPESEANLFIDSIRGKVNVQNGVLDFVTGSLLEHSPRYGFQYVLPYNYDPDAYSEYFMDWLETVTQSNPDLMESLLDFMAYCFLPGYDDHAFMYLVGEGSNGKSTLFEILQKLLGAGNYSTVNINQLTRNRFAPAMLEGKLANLGEESSGDDVYLDAEQTNVLKTLSAGGSLFVENKGERGFNLTNSAKLIFLANKPPLFKETGEAVKRRLLVIPFNYKIERRDPRVRDKLLREVPGIFSMLVTRVQDNLRQHGGVFKLARGGEAAKTAQTKMLNSGNTALRWAEESVEMLPILNDDDFIPIRDAYAHYVQYCEACGFRPQNINTFSFNLQQNLLLPSSRTPVQKINGKAVRVFRRIRWA